MRISHEHLEQSAFFDWVNYNIGLYPALSLMYAIPNGGMRPSDTNDRGKRFSVIAQKMKEEGVRRGVLDIHLPFALGDYIGMWIEMKWGKNTLTEEQEWWVKNLREAGHYVAVCYSCEEAIAVTIYYLNLKG
jgi:hypothetical protein